MTACLSLPVSALRFSSGVTLPPWLVIPGWDAPWRCYDNASDGPPWRRTPRGSSLPARSVPNISALTKLPPAFFIHNLFLIAPGPTSLWTSLACHLLMVTLLSSWLWIGSQRPPSWFHYPSSYLLPEKLLESYCSICSACMASLPSDIVCDRGPQLTSRFWSTRLLGNFTISSNTLSLYAVVLTRFDEKLFFLCDYWGCFQTWFRERGHLQN